MDVLIVGQTGVLGAAIARALEGRHRIVGASRRGSPHKVDITSASTIADLFVKIGGVDAIVCVAGDNKFAPLNDLTEADYQYGFESKVMGQVNLVRHGIAHVNDHGSITITSGVTGRQPIPGTSSIALNNAALEGFVRSAAREIPRGIRLNCVSPQWAIPTLQQYGMDPAWGVTPEEIALAYVESVEGRLAGTIIDAGWTHDATVGSASVVGMSA